MGTFVKTCIANTVVLAAIAVPVFGTGCERQGDPPIEPRALAPIAGAGPQTGAPSASSDPAAAAPGGGDATLSQNDAAITARVKTALMADDQVKGLAIDVDTKDAQVTLKGALDHKDQVTRAVEVAQAIDGVREVVNRLSVKGEDKAADINKG